MVLYILIRIILLFLGCSIQAIEYIYPVARADINGAACVCLMYQKKNGLELLSWDLQTKEVAKLLSLRFMPTDVQFLPDQSGFSFIDQGVIWVKSFLKRSPRKIDVPLPLCDIDLIFWKTGQSCYFSARYCDRNALFELDLHGNLDCIILFEAVDCVYPQKINKKLFFISRNCNDNSYQLMQTIYPDIYHSPLTFNSIVNFDQRVEQLYSEFRVASIPLISYSACSIEHVFRRGVSFLKMISESEGFVLENPFDVSLSIITYPYYHLEKKEGKWSYTLLFTFGVPLSLTKVDNTGFTCLYESILPFLPRFFEETKQFFYSDFSEEGVNVFCYDLNKKCVFKIVQCSNILCFAPYYINGGLILGGTINTIIDSSHYVRSEPFMWLNANSRVCLDLYAINLK